MTAVLAESAGSTAHCTACTDSTNQGQFGYPASYTNVDRARGNLVHMMFSAR